MPDKRTAFRRTPGSNSAHRSHSFQGFSKWFVQHYGFQSSKCICTWSNRACDPIALLQTAIQNSRLPAGEGEETKGTMKTWDKHSKMFLTLVSKAVSSVIPKKANYCSAQRHPDLQPQSCIKQFGNTSLRSTSVSASR